MTNSSFVLVTYYSGSQLSGFDSRDQRDVGAAVVSDAEQPMKVWVTVLTEMPYSSTSARRQSKNAWTACLEAASGKITAQPTQSTGCLFIGPKYCGIHLLIHKPRQLTRSTKRHR